MIELSEITIGVIAAAVITGFISVIGLIISKEQKVSEFRQAWIDSLRDEISKLISNANAIHGAGMADFQTRSEEWKNVGPNFIKINEAVANIRLRLNSNEKDSQEILETIQQIEALFTDGLSVDYKNLGTLEKNLVAKTQIVLKGEWVRVRKGELVYRVTRNVAITFLIVALLGLVMTILR